MNTRMKNEGREDGVWTLVSFGAKALGTTLAGLFTELERGSGEARDDSWT